MRFSALTLLASALQDAQHFKTLYCVSSGCNFCAMLFADVFSETALGAFIFLYS